MRGITLASSCLLGVLLSFAVVFVIDLGPPIPPLLGLSVPIGPDEITEIRARNRSVENAECGDSP